MKEIYNIDMEKSQKPKTLDKLPPIDIAITMGCEVYCPYLEAKYKEDWGLDDPSGKSDKEFKEVIEKIEEKIKNLRKDFLEGNLNS